MKLIVKDMDIATGGINVIILNENDAAKLDLHYEDRVLIKKGRRNAIAVVDIAQTGKAVKPGHVGLFEESLKAIKVNETDEIHLFLAEKPVSTHHIKEKLNGKELNKREIDEIVKDIVDNRLTKIELSYFVSANYVNGLSEKETLLLTKAMINTGGKLKLKNKIIADKHSIGGVPGNRTTPLVVPICVAAGLTFPKTSSRSITSPAGTADTMEVLCNVDFSIKEIHKLVQKNGGCMVWGGAVNLAPADDKIIKVENPLSIDPEGQLLASIMAKKGSVSANHVLIDIPIGKTAKISNEKEAKRLAKRFKDIGKKIGMKIDVMITDGSEPIGNGIGPVLEAKGLLYILKNDPRQSFELREKSLRLAGRLLELAHKAIKGRGYEKAKYILETGKAYDVFVKLVKAQGGKNFNPDKISLGKYKFDFKSKSSGVVKEINNKAISKVARIAGAPKDNGAGIYLYCHVGDHVKKGEKLFTVYAESKKKLKYSKRFFQLADGFVVGRA